MPTTDANDAFSGQQNNPNMSYEEYLRHISDQLERLIRSTRNQSQSAAADDNRGKSFRDLYDDYVGRGYTGRYSSTRRSSFRRSRGLDTDSFFDSFEETMIESVLGHDYKDRINSAINEFADQFGLDLEHIEEQLGRELGKQVSESLKSSRIGRIIYSEVDKTKSNLLSYLSELFRSGVAEYDSKHGSHYADTYDEFVKRQAARSAADAASGGTGRTARNAAEGFTRAASEQAARDAFRRATSSAASEAASNAASSAAGETAANVGANAAAGAAGAGASAAGSAGTSMMISTAAKSASSGLLSLGSASSTAGGGLAAMGGTASGAGAALSGLMKIAPKVALAIIAIKLVTKALKYALGPAIEGTKKLFHELKNAGMRYIDSREKQVEFEKKRMADDLESIVRKPFEILESAAANVYEVWDNYLRKINATQGYNKEDLQSLMGAFAQRLRDEGLSEVISTTDIISSLSTVLDSGLSGKAAEEFAYVAAKLNAAVPTQDFFGYAGTYASIAANAVKDGMSQSQALEYANTQLYSFANSVLYASRNLAGGFTTGLKNAQSLFEQSVQISQAGHTNNAANIGSVLTAVSAVVGAIAPDLASSMTDVIYKAATGGNASELVALRSLAHINASNTEFLRKISQDPQSVFAELFKNLANMQHMADGAWMEVAEGLSSVFGVSMDAFARVDFGYLADVIANMNANSTALQDNFDLLAEGQTTTNEEQLKIAQINKYMIEEGLSYVLDNQAARAIQQHMWEEQIAQEIMEAEYGVKIHGAALDFLQGLRKTVDRILNFLNPLGFLVKLFKGTADSIKEYHAQEADLRRLLEVGKVGQGNATAMYQLTTRGKQLHITDALVNLMGGSSAYARISASNAASRNWLTGASAFGAPVPGLGPFASTAFAGMLAYDIASNLAAGESGSERYAGKIGSQYQWGMMSKSRAAAVSSGSSAASLTPMLTAQDIQSAKEEANTKLLAEKMGKLMEEEYVKGFAKDSSKTYEDWIETASKFGISDLSAGLESIGKNEEDLKGIFEGYRTEAGSSESRRREEKEESLWDATFIYQPAVEALLGTNNELTTTTNSLLTTTNELLTANNMTLSFVLKKETEFYDDWVNYFVSHTAYNQSYDYTQVAKVQKAEKHQSDSAIYALAEALSKNTVDLKDPAVQTNALLSQILLVVNALLQRNNQTGATTLLGTLAGLALGGETPTI